MVPVLQLRRYRILPDRAHPKPESDNREHSADFDAVMLGGLGEIVGPGYLKYTTIRARYQLSGDRVTVVDIRVDGVNRPGTVALPKTSRCSV